MINCERGNLRMRGGGIILSAACIRILKGMRQVLADQYGEENVENEMLRLVSLSAMSGEQIQEEVEKLNEQLVEMALDNIFGEKSKNGSNDL